MRKGFVKQHALISSRDCSDVSFKEKGDFCKECKKIMKNAMDIRIYSSETLAEEFDRNCKFFYYRYDFYQRLLAVRAPESIIQKEIDLLYEASENMVDIVAEDNINMMFEIFEEEHM